MGNAVTERGRSLIEEFEWVGREAVRQADGRWVIGFGHTETARQGQRITPDEAHSLLDADLVKAGAAVADAVTVDLNDNEYSALLSLMINIGAENFKKSAVLKRLNGNKRIEAALAFQWWNKARTSTGTDILEGLAARRAYESALFLTPVESGDPADLSDPGRRRSFRTTPKKEMPSRRRLIESRTLRGALIAGMAAVLAFVNQLGSAIEHLQPDSALSKFLRSIPSEVYLRAGVALFVITLAALAYIAYARIDDWRKGRR